MNRGIPRRAALRAFAAFATTAVSSSAAPVSQPLFRIARSKNANIVQYDAIEVAPRRLELRQPVVGYWIMLAEKGQREELTSLEQRAYGFRIHAEREGLSYLMVLRAVPDRSIRVFHWNGRWIAQLRLQNKNAVLERVFVSSEEGALLPRVRWIDLFGHDIVTGAPLTERLTPG